MSTIIKVGGFNNLGNTCYMNSALQALLSSNVINTSLMLYTEKYPKSIKNLSPILLEYIRIIVNLIDKNASNQAATNYLQGINSNTVMTMYRPDLFKNTLDAENEWFKGSAQHDSSELLQYMLSEFGCEKRSKSMSKLIKKLCFGQFKQYIYCAECEEVSISYFSFLDVILPIPNVKNIDGSVVCPDLEDCFKLFAEYEKMDNDEKWNCPECKKKVVAWKKMEIHDVPEVAIFTLNRFKDGRLSSGNNFIAAKNTTTVNIYQHIELEGKKMKMIATINHYGGVNGGHYVAHVSRGDTWFRADDSRVNEIDPTTLLSDPSVYVVIYQIERLKC
jgi:ubiquitin C-terminal hydrolase